MNIHQPRAEATAHSDPRTDRGSRSRRSQHQRSPRKTPTTARPAPEPRTSGVESQIEASSGRGLGSAINHFGEILQGIFRTPAGEKRPGLLTCPDATNRSEATFHPTNGTGVTVIPPRKTKSRRAAELTLRLRGLPPGGVLLVRGTAPEGSGQGSSTSDVTAAVIAAASSYGVRVTPEEIARIAVEVETACDSTMFGVTPLLFAQRHGEVIEDFGVAVLPALWVVAFEVGAPVDTVALPLARYNDRDLERFEALRARLRAALKASDASAVGGVATESAEINERHLHKEGFHEFVRIAERVGGVGVQVAHSGSGVGILFDAQAPDLADRLDDAEDLLSAFEIRSMRRFRTCPINAGR